MGCPTFKVLFNKQNDTVQYDVSKLVDVSLGKGIGAKSGYLTLTLKEISQLGIPDGGLDTDDMWISNGDVIEIYAKQDGSVTTTSADILIQGVVNKINVTEGEGGRRFKIECLDRTRVLLQKYVMIGATDIKDKTPAEIIEHIVSDASSTSPGGLKITATLEAPVTPATGIANAKNDLSAFNDIPNYWVYMKTFFEWMETLSQPGYTGDDKPYTFYINNDNELLWFYPDRSGVSSNISYGQKEVVSINMQKSLFDVVNMIIYNSGKDMNGNGIQYYYINTTSASNGIKMQYYTWEDIATQGLTREQEYGEQVNGETYGSDGYPNDYNTGGTGYSTNGCWFLLGDIESSPKVVNYDTRQTPSNDSEFNTAFRDYCKVEGYRRAEGYTKYAGELRWNGSITVRGTNEYVPGQVIVLNWPPLKIFNEELRVQDIQQVVNAGGWFTTIKLDKDPKIKET